MHPTSRLAAWRGAAALALLLVVVSAGQLVALQSTAMVEVDPEESVNAGQGLALLAGHVRDLPRLQYIDFCGGCTVDAVMGAAVFSVLPLSFLAWKLVPLLWLLGFTAVACHRLGRLVGFPAAVAAGALILLPPELWLRLSLIGLGNHYECGVLVGVALLLLGPDPGPRRAAAVGLLLGVAVWVGYSASFGLPAALAFLLLRRRWRPALALGAGAAAGLTTLLWRAWLTRRYPIRTLYPPEWFWPDPGRLADKAADLLRPTELAAIFGATLDPTGLVWIPVVLGLLATGWLALTRAEPLPRLLLLALACWGAAYGVVGFRVEQYAPGQLISALGLRYLAPVLALGLLLQAAVSGSLWRDGHRAAAIALLAPTLSAGLLARAASFADRVPLAVLARFHAVDSALWNDVFSERPTESELARCASRRPDHVALRGWARGRLAAASGAAPARGEDLDAWAGGLGMGYQRLLPPGDRRRTSPEPCDDAAGPDAGLVARLDALALPPAARRAALRSFWSSQILDRGPPAQCPRDGESRAALQWALGREVGRGVAWFQPRPEAHEVAIDARRSQGALDRDWLVGLGFSAGERWGPMGHLPTVGGLDGREQAALWDGYVEGFDARWLPASGR